VAISLLYLITQ